MPMFDEKSGFNITTINADTLDVSVFDLEHGMNQNFTWKPVSFIENILILHLTFEQPLKISASKI